jgi:hypothetical protein
LDKKESTRNCLKYRRAKGEILLVTHEGRGWWDPTSAAKGDIFGLVQLLNPSLSFREIRKILRPFIGLSPTLPVHERPSAKPAPDVPCAVTASAGIADLALSDRDTPSARARRVRRDRRRHATGRAPWQCLVCPS